MRSIDCGAVTLSLAQRTTLGVGGPARRHLQVSASTAAVALAELDEPVLVLGGGSNLLVADAGFPGTVLELVPADDSPGVRRAGDLLHVDAAMEWDDLVAWACAADLAGLECLSGIPGRVGAAPMQNIGAYGQEVGERLVSVDTVEIATGTPRTFVAADCALGYRTSRFKHAEKDRWLVTGVTLRLVPGGAPTLRYAELVRRAEEHGVTSLSAVRDLVIGIRRSKSMVVDPTDANSRSAGSFFTNPIVAEPVAEDVRRRARARGVDGPVPSWPADGGTKLAAAWLIERAGFSRGWGDGPARLSEKHTLAIVNRGDATAADVTALAATVRRGVRDAFGVTLVPEPVFVGFDAGPDPSDVLDAAEAAL